MRPELCVSDVDECFIDWDCVGDRKCCSNGCYRVCASPSLGSAAAAGRVTLVDVSLTYVKGNTKIRRYSRLTACFPRDKPERFM